MWALLTDGCWYNIPCLGGKEPSDMCLNSAFSAPNNWIVDDGSLASFAKDPAKETNRTVNCASNNFTISGNTLGASSSIYSDKFLIEI